MYEVQDMIEVFNYHLGCGIEQVEESLLESANLSALTEEQKAHFQAVRKGEVVEPVEEEVKVKKRAAPSRAKKTPAPSKTKKTSAPKESAPTEKAKTTRKRKLDEEPEAAKKRVAKRAKKE